MPDPNWLETSLLATNLKALPLQIGKEAAQNTPVTILSYRYLLYLFDNCLGSFKLFFPVDIILVGLVQLAFRLIFNKYFFYLEFLSFSCRKYFFCRFA